MCWSARAKSQGLWFLIVRYYKNGFIREVMDRSYLMIRNGCDRRYAQKPFVYQILAVLAYSLMVGNRNSSNGNLYGREKP